MITLGISGLVLFALAVVLITLEAAVEFFPSDAKERVSNKKGKNSDSLSWIVLYHDNVSGALRLWFMWCATAAIVAVSLLLYELVGNFWIAGFISASIFAIAGFFFFGVPLRRFGRRNSLAIATKLSGFIRFLTMVLGPIPGWLVRCNTKISPYFSDNDVLFTDNELHDFVERANESQIFEEDEARMLHSVIEFGRTRVRAVLVPRTNLVTIGHKETLDDAVRLFVDSGFSRIPVITEDPDHIVGILYAKDVMEAFYRQAAGLNSETRCDDITELMREAYFIPESKLVDDVLELMKRESNHLAVVVDEYGGTAGIVTLEDIVEEIVGEIVDEYDQEDSGIKQLDERTYRVMSTTNIEEVAELFGRRLSDEHVDTVGGLMSKVLGKVPIAADTIDVDGLKLVAEQNNGQQNFYITISETASDRE